MAPVVSPGSSPDQLQLPKTVTIVGAGLAGTLTAILLDRCGCSVTLVDSLKVYPKEFRAEQVVVEEELRQLGLLEAVVGNAIPVGRARAFRMFWRWGWLAKSVASPHYGLPYDAMVNNARRHLPASVDFIHERVDEIELSPDNQRVTLRSGQVVESRLVILATGLQSQLLGKVNITRKMLSKEHSTAIGFDITVDCHEKFRDGVLTIYGNNWLGGDENGAIDYVTFFLMGDSLRGNIFTNGKCNNDWTRRFRRDPIDTLLKSVPWLESQTGRILAIDNVRVRPNDIMIVENHRQAGVVCVGDTYLSPCPATGTGIWRMLKEIDLLGTEYVPGWLLSPGMGTEKINEFYDDARKKARDESALTDAMYHRGNTLQTGFRWVTRRVKAAVLEQVERGTRWAQRPRPR